MPLEKLPADLYIKGRTNFSALSIYPQYFPFLTAATSSLKELAPSYKKGITVPWAPNVYNHMTVEQNKFWADKVYQEIKDYHEKENRPRIS